MGKRAPNTLGRCFVQSTEDVIDIANVELWVFLSETIGALPARFVLLDPDPLVRRKMVEIHAGNLAALGARSNRAGSCRCARLGPGVAFHGSRAYRNRSCGTSSLWGRAIHRELRSSWLARREHVWHTRDEPIPGEPPEIHHVESQGCSPQSEPLEHPWRYRAPLQARGHGAGARPRQDDDPQGQHLLA